MLANIEVFSVYLDPICFILWVFNLLLTSSFKMWEVPTYILLNLEENIFEVSFLFHLYAE